MSSGLLALLDDIAAIVKVTAASLDDVATQAVKASSKAAGVVIDDAAVTPKYVVGLSPSREIPIVWNIAKGSLRNKLLILLPAVMLLGAIAPWSVGPLLAIGGLFLCFEGFEKLHRAVHHYLHPQPKEATGQIKEISPEELERERTSGAIRTDFILSAEILAISYAVVKDESFWLKLTSLVGVAFVITAGVYGFVALILKADDAGLRLARDKNHSIIQKFGRGLILGMPFLLIVLSIVGTAAMLWVGGGIIIHSIPAAHHWLEGLVDSIGATGFLAWLVEATVSLVFAIFMGFLAVQVVQFSSVRKNTMNRCLARLRLPLSCCFCVVTALTLAFYFLPWRFVIPGFRFPYHGMPSLVIGLIALCVGLIGTNRNWALPRVNWPWLAAIVLVVIQVGLLVSFLQGPDVAVGKGTSVSPWGETAIEMPFDIKPLWGAYAAVTGSLVSLALSVLTLLANRIVAEPSDPFKSPVDREFES